MNFCFTVNDGDGATYEPWTDGYAVGYKVTWGDWTEYVYMNPSSRSPDEPDDGNPNVFVYIGSEGQPGQDPSVHYYTLFDGIGE